MLKNNQQTIEKEKTKLISFGFTRSPKARARLTGAVAGWDFEDGAGTILRDITENGHNGVLNNMEAADWGENEIGGMLNFDGVNEYVEVSGYTIPVSAFSVSFWVYLNALPDSDFERAIDQTKMIFTFGSAVGGNRNKLRFNISDAITTVAQIMTDDDLVAETWYHAVGTYQPNLVKFYLNSVQQGSTDISAVMATPTTTFTLGKKADAASNYFNGKMSQIIIYDRVLPAEEIRDIYRLKGKMPGKITRRVKYQDTKKVGFDEYLKSVLRIMPKKLERKLKIQARKKGFVKDGLTKRGKKYVYGTMRKTGWTPSHQKKRSASKK